MYDIAAARILHILGVVLWIGGVAFVTTVLLPAVKRFKNEKDRIEFFENVENIHCDARFLTNKRLTAKDARGRKGIMDSHSCRSRRSRKPSN